MAPGRFRRMAAGILERVIHAQNVEERRRQAPPFALQPAEIGPTLRRNGVADVFAHAPCPPAVSQFKADEAVIAEYGLHRDDAGNALEGVPSSCRRSAGFSWITFSDSMSSSRRFRPMRPVEMMMTRSQMASTSERMCVDSRIVWFSPKLLEQGEGLANLHRIEAGGRPRRGSGSADYDRWRPPGDAPADSLGQRADQTGAPP